MNKFTIGSWNVNSIKVRTEQVKDLLRENFLDVLAVQELKTSNENFPYYLRQTGYDVIVNGQKQYNGVATFSSSNLIEHSTSLILDDKQARFLVTIHQEIAVVNVYTPNGQSLESDKYQYKINWLSNLYDFIKNLQKEFSKIIILGDFNIIKEDIDAYPSYSYEMFRSAKERQALEKIMSLGFIDTYRAIHPEKIEYSWWDYRNFSFPKNKGLRIDLILASNDLSKHLIDAKIHLGYRKHTQPSDHTLITASFNLL